MVGKMRNLCVAFSELSEEIENSTKALKSLSTATEKMAIGEKSNNWRKLHGLPMIRRMSDV